MGEVITITGHSDDVVNIEGNGSGIDEAGDGAALIVLGVNDLGNAGVRVKMRYTRNGVWTAEVGPVQEGLAMLVTTIKAADNGYSVEVSVHGAVSVIREHEGDQ
jgi:hypothetical protein